MATTRLCARRGIPLTGHLAMSSYASDSQVGGSGPVPAAPAGPSSQTNVSEGTAEKKGKKKKSKDKVYSHQPGVGWA